MAVTQGWGVVKEGGVGNCCPLQLCPGVWKVPADSAEKAAPAVGSCTAPVVTGVTLWLTEMVGGSPHTYHCDVTRGLGRSRGWTQHQDPSLHPCKRGASKGWSWLQEAGEMVKGISSLAPSQPDGTRCRRPQEGAWLLPSLPVRRTVARVG